MTLKNTFTENGGTIISGEEPVLIDLAYPMTKVVGTTRHKCDSGYFGWVKFEIGKDGLAAVKKSLDGNDDVLRYLLVKTVRENTLLHGKMMLKKEEVRKMVDVHDGEIEASDMDEAALPASSVDEIDKSIDDLVSA